MEKNHFRSGREQITMENNDFYYLKTFGDLTKYTFGDLTKNQFSYSV